MGLVGLASGEQETEACLLQYPEGGLLHPNLPAAGTSGERGVPYPGCLWVLETGEKSLVKRVPRFTLAAA